MPGAGMPGAVLSEAEKRLKRCCFTGHRPEKLGCDEAEAVKLLGGAISDAYAAGYRTFISGMARGVDIWAAELVLKERRTHPGIHLICALPHPDFETRWRAEWQRRYRDVLVAADLVKTICPSFSMSAYQKRNEWMVDHSSRIIAFYNGAPGGTANTISYAQKRGVEIIIVNNQSQSARA